MENFALFDFKSGKGDCCSEKISEDWIVVTTDNVEQGLIVGDWIRRGDSEGEGKNRASAGMNH